LNILQRFRQTAISAPTAFSEMYERNRVAVFRYIYSLMGGPADDAEDLTAETFIRAWKARHAFEGNVDSAIGWLLRIAKRVVIDNHRRNSVRRTSALQSDLKSETTTEEEFLRIQQGEELLNLLKDLPTEHREILILRYVLDWKVNQIATHVGLSENHVSVIIHRTLTNLRKQWTSSSVGKSHETH
jgi:RNA polymerase sigma factor, sigma-70 family